MLRRPLLFALWLYRRLLSPALTFIFQPLGFGCRFHPTCSCYATEAITKHGPRKGLILATRRVLRCNPWGGQGHDPVPDQP